MFLHLSVILLTGGLCPSMHHRSHDWGGLCLRGSLSRGGLCLGVSFEGVSVRETPRQRPPFYSNERAVRILLECILVLNVTDFDGCMTVQRLTWDMVDWATTKSHVSLLSQLTDESNQIILVHGDEFLWMLPDWVSMYANWCSSISPVGRACK